MKTQVCSVADSSTRELSVLVQHELQNPLLNLQGALRLLSTGRFGKLSSEGSQLLHQAVVNLDRLQRLAIAVEEQPQSLKAILSEEQLRLLALQRDLPRAIINREIYLVYQPIFNPAANQIIGFEALARWQHPIYGAIPPNVFIPLAEEQDLIHSMGKNLIEEACCQLRAWQKTFPEHQNLTISVNLSVLQLSKLDLPHHIEQVVAATKINPANLKLEITESAIIENSEVVSEVLQRLRGLGVKLHLDDFGTGYSALSRLQGLPVDTLKIDRSFVANKNWEICEVILTLANKLGLRVIVEGIETQEEATILGQLGFQQMQGYLFSHPLSAEMATSHLEKTVPTTRHLFPTAIQEKCPCLVSASMLPVAS
ncbi:diguanylate phosphodiesterase [filamentous cyanobacterium CCP5]|nr:diguanylate phosphodiesterase [filamentous cyanobacterium CCP5]